MFGQGFEGLDHEKERLGMSGANHLFSQEQFKYITYPKMLKL